MKLVLFRINEIILVLFFSGALGYFVAIGWENRLLSTLSSALFKFFLPGFFIATNLSGGGHDGSEIHVIVGTMLQTLFIYALLKVVWYHARGN